MSAETEVSSTREDIKELKHLLEIAIRPKVEALLTVELRRFENKLLELETVDKEKSKNNEESEISIKPTSLSKTYDVPYKSYSWDQSDKFVKFYLTNLKNVQELPHPDGFEKCFQPRAISFRVCNLSGKNHVLEIKELAHDINVDKSYFKVKSDMIVIFLAKAKLGQHWSHVTAAEKAKADKKNEVPKMADDDGDPSKGLMNMMKKMYDDGDDDMKRTIAKAWTESQNKGPGAGLGAGGLGDMDL